MADNGEIDQLSRLMVSYDEQMSNLDAKLAEIEEENANDANMTAVQQYHEDYHNYPTSLTAPAEDEQVIMVDDALDRVIHLETLLKIRRRHNELMAKERVAYRNRLRKEGNSLQKTSDELDMVVDATGWHDKYVLDKDDLYAKKENVHDMAVLEQKVRREVKATQFLTKKKEDTLCRLRDEVEKTKEKQIELNEWYNKVRVARRDIAEEEAQLAVLQRDDDELTRQVAVLEDSKAARNASVEILEADKAFLKRNRMELSRDVYEQRRISRAQTIREEELRKRINVLMMCLTTMKLEKAYREKALEVEEGAVVTQNPEPKSISDVIPDNETVPIDSYRLVAVTNDKLQDSVGDKQMLALERESVLVALNAQLLRAIERHNENVDELDMSRFEKDSVSRQLIEDIQSRHEAFRRRMEVLSSENTRLRNELSQKQQRERRRKQ